MKDNLKKVDIFSNLSDRTLKKVEGITKVKELKKGEILFLEKDKVNSIYIVFKGKVSMYRYSQKGQKRVVYILANGEVINEVIFDSLPASITCEAFEKSIIYEYDVEELTEIMKEDFLLAQNIIHSTGRKVRRLYRQLKNTIPIGLEKKLAAKLWKLSKDYGVDCYTKNMACQNKNPECVSWTKLDLKITVTYLAEMLGSTRETISREMKKLENQSLIKWEGRTIFVKRKEILEFYRS